MAKAFILNDLFKSKGIKVSAFEKAIGVANGTVSKAIDRDGEITEWVIEKIVKQYPDVNAKWLATGKGQMLADIEKPLRKVPIIGEAAAGGDMQIYTNENQEVEYIDVGDMLRDSEAAFTVYGNSMNPNYPSGCILGIKRCYDGFIQPGEIYLLETKSNRVFKRLYYNDANTGYTCFSDNTLLHETGAMKGKYYYPPFDVKFDDVIRIFDVTGMIKRTRNSGIVMRQK